MKITATQLRQIIREEALKISEDAPPNAPSMGKDIKGTSTVAAATKKIEANPAIISAMNKISTAKDLASFMQDLLTAASKKGITQQELQSAVNQLKTALGQKSVDHK